MKDERVDGEDDSVNEVVWSHASVGSKTERHV